MWGKVEKRQKSTTILPTQPQVLGRFQKKKTAEKNILGGRGGSCRKKISVRNYPTKQGNFGHVTSYSRPRTCVGIFSKYFFKSQPLVCSISRNLKEIKKIKYKYLKSLCRGDIFLHFLHFSSSVISLGNFGLKLHLLYLRSCKPESDHCFMFIDVTNWQRIDVVVKKVSFALKKFFYVRSYPPIFHVRTYPNCISGGCKNYFWSPQQKKKNLSFESVVNRKVRN